MIIKPTLSSPLIFTDININSIKQPDFSNFAIDFLNLIFGNGNDTEIFWQEILKKQVYLHFNFETPEKKNIAAGLLLNSICFHCQLNLNYDNKVELFTHNSPFQLKHFFGFIYYAKIYKLKYLEINQMMVNNLVENDLDLYEKFLRIQEVEEIASKTEDSYCQFNLKIKIIETLFKKSQRELALNEIEECLQIFNNMHPLQLKLYFELIKSSFIEERNDKAKSLLKKCETIIVFNFQNYHPIYIILYDLFAEHYNEKNELEKAAKYYEKSLNQSLKIFGINHIQTAECILKSANIKLKLKEISEGLEDFIKACNIIEALKGYNSKITLAVCYKLSHLLFNNGKINIFFKNFNYFFLSIF